MADTKVSALTALAAADVATNDLVYIVDVSATTSGSKAITIANLFAGINTANGIDINPGSDTDSDLVTVGVTGAPKLSWDESEDSFVFSKRLSFGTSTGAETTYDAYVFVNRAVDGTGSNNGHCFGDYSVVTRSAGIGYNSFNSQLTVSGSANYDHFAGFQQAGTFGTSGTIDDLYGLWTGPTISAGTVTNAYGVYISASSGAGAVTNDYGICIATGGKGASLNYSIYCVGTAPSYHKGNLGIGIGATPQTDKIVYIAGNSTTANINKTGFSVEQTYTGTYCTGVNVQCASAGSSAILGIFGLYNRPNHGSSSTLDNFYGIYSAPTSTGGTVSNLYHTYISNCTGTVTNQYGLYVDQLTTGVTADYAIYTAGTTPSRFEGPVHLKNATGPAALTDGCVIYATDQTGGNSCVHAKTEGGAVIKLYQQAHIADATGGATVDTEARAAVNAILAALENAGFLATS